MSTMRIEKLLIVVVGLYFTPPAFCQDTIAIYESNKSDWALGTLDSLNTWSDTLTLDTVRGYHFLFTNCGQTGISGPAQVSITSAYAGTDLAGSVTGINGVQYWETPEGGLYRIKAAGAGHNADSLIRGAIVQADFELSKTTGLYILAGQMGDSPRGGNGGTFVSFAADSTPLLVAGGAAGMRSYVDAANSGSTANSGQSVSGPGCSAAGGTAGAGGLAAGGGNCSGAGGGFYGNGQGCGGGFSFINGGTGGTASYVGGFGGGGGVNSSSSPGGGGGYSGGSVHYTGGGSSCAGGGGSFIDSLGSAVATSDGYYNNSMLFQADSIQALNAWQYGHGFVAADAMQFVSSGMRTSPVYDISTPAFMYTSSMINWQAETFTGTDVKMETRYSLNDGIVWSLWDTVTNGGTIAGLTPGVLMDSARLQARMTLSTTAYFATPRVYSVSITVINDTVSTSSITNPGEIRNLSVFPNPFDHTIQVSYYLPGKAVTAIHLHSLIGQTFKLRPLTIQAAGRHDLAINTTELNLPEGIYWVEITTDGMPQRRKLLHVKSGTY